MGVVHPAAAYPWTSLLFWGFFEIWKILYWCFGAVCTVNSSLDLQLIKENRGWPHPRHNIFFETPIHIAAFFASSWMKTGLATGVSVDNLNSSKYTKKCTALFTGSAMSVQRSNYFTVALFTFVELQCITLSNYFLQTMLQCLIPLELWSLQCNFTPLSKSIQTLRRWFTKHISSQKKQRKKQKTNTPSAQ